jgi:hypothetical protein
MNHNFSKIEAVVSLPYGVKPVEKIFKANRISKKRVLLIAPHQHYR